MLAMREFNQRLSHYRVAGEWRLTEMTDKSTFVDMKAQPKAMLSPVEVRHKVATILPQRAFTLEGRQQAIELLQGAAAAALEKLSPVRSSQRQLSAVRGVKRLARLPSCCRGYC